MIVEPGVDNYVLGFAFNGGEEVVALIEKKRPPWQRGCLNGIGGKVKEGEKVEAAMRREFCEETAKDVAEWQLFAKVFNVGQDRLVQSVVWCFKSTCDLYSLESPTDERVVLEPVADLEDSWCLYNVRWLVEMARCMRAGPAYTIEDAHWAVRMEKKP